MTQKCHVRFCSGSEVGDCFIDHNHRTSAGLRPHFRGFGPDGGFCVWWFFPPNPALAGNASR